MTTAEKLIAIAENQQKVYDAGYAAGQASGGAYYDEFWDAYQDGGNRTNYSSAFGVGWSDAIFRPKYDMQPTDLSYCFSNSGITNLKSNLEDCGVVLDTSKTYNLNSAFYLSKVTHVPTLDTRSVAGTALTNAFYQSKVVSIDKLILKDDGTQSFTNMFTFCSSLENIVIEGCIGQNISFVGSSKLSHDSLMSIINALKDYSGDSTTYTLTIGTTNKNKLSAEELSVAENKGWQVK